MKLPLFFENSKIPGLLSKISPIEIEAISLGIAVFSKEKMNEQTKNHESIHFRQWVELGFIGFLILYPAFWIRNRLRGMNGELAYFKSPFELEAYQFQNDLKYLERRHNYAWLHFLEG